MNAWNRLLNCIVAAVFATVTFSLPAAAAEDRLGALFERLRTAEPADAGRIAGDIEHELSKSGSAAADLLLKRGRDALEAGDVQAAIEHFTALTDHAPDFAEGWHMRAMALAEAEQFGPAIADIERALALEPRHFNALASLGGILAHIERPELAGRAFRAVLAIHPNHKDVSEALERIERESGGREL